MMFYRLETNIISSVYMFIIFILLQTFWAIYSNRISLSRFSFKLELFDILVFYWFVCFSSMKYFYGVFLFSEKAYMITQIMTMVVWLMSLVWIVKLRMFGKEIYRVKSKNELIKFILVVPLAASGLAFIFYFTFLFSCPIILHIASCENSIESMKVDDVREKGRGKSQKYGAVFFENDTFYNPQSIAGVSNWKQIKIGDNIVLKGSKSEYGMWVYSYGIHQ